MSNLGVCYRDGIGVMKDERKAFECYKKAANMNDFGGIINLEIGKVGFATVFCAYWLNKNDNISEKVALKVIHKSNKEVENFIQELKYYCEIGYENPSFLECHGVSRDDITKDYILVLNYADEGSLRQNIETVSQIIWKDKLNILYCIASDLEAIHSQELIHRDLHSCNILQLIYTALTLLIWDFLHHQHQEDEINGVMPYVTPEVLQGNPYTQEADIYSFDIIMTELATGKRAF
ncbi:kinase-like domain-containing protein [Gigaspora rosea]|uniref:Kinase-like domain-containing protein n=1 Tax=Gigaspora rosea TaxID=44941 RepID=A0A397U7L0_9GLOM|nr:kinase-like domain-containing protein [Gigaspora rosea]